MFVTGKKFRDVTLQLDGNSFKGCTFTNCQLVFSAITSVGFDECDFKDVSWSFQGPASNAVAFMRVLYAAGLVELAENIFRHIRGEEQKGGPVLH